MIAYEKTALDKFFGNVANSSPDDRTNRWIADDKIEQLYFKIWPKLHRGHIRLVVNRMAVLDLSICGVTSVGIVFDKLEILEVRFTDNHSGVEDVPESCYRINILPKIYIEMPQHHTKPQCATLPLFRMNSYERLPIVNSN